MNKFFKILLISCVTFSLFSGLNEDLLAAAKAGDPAGVEAAIAAGADVNYINDIGINTLIVGAKYGLTALMFAAREGHIDIVRLLLDRGANINAINDYERTALMWAANTGHTDVVRLLLDRGANINAVDGDGDTALMSASESGHTYTVRLLLDRGANINAINGNGDTVLIGAAKIGHADTVRLLLKMGANPDHVNRHGNTALKLARRRGLTKVVKILEEASKIKQLIDRTIQNDSSSHQELIERIKDLNIDSYEFNLILNHLINKISDLNSDVEMSNIRKMLITLAKIMAIEFARYFGFGIASKISHIELPQELAIEYLLSQFLKERLSPINLQIKIPMAYGGSENFLELVAHEYGELERQVIKVREKRESKIVN